MNVISGKKMIVPLADLSIKTTSKYLQSIKNILMTGNFILGNEGEEFENEFASYLGMKYCAGVGSGTDAILFALKALGISPQDEVIVPAFTFIATATPVLMLGAIPVF